MANPPGIHQLAWFYPLGNTPARSLTQDLTKEGDATILCLGSGDIRHALFTSHLEPLRSIDITCVDLDAAVIARNVLMLSLILEAKDNWEIYYHTKISHQSLKLIHVQAQKLQNITWEGRLRFADQITLLKVKEVWKTYTTLPDLKEALNVRKKYLGEQVIDHSLLRSLAPISFPDSEGFSKHGNNFWQKGCLDGTAEWPNPLFGSQSVMHYATHPLLGFHLALGTQFIQGGDGDLIAAAKTQFSAWADSFRKSKTIVAYCWSDALSFAHAVQGFSGYRDSYHMQPLILGHQTFDLIDTSNLADHIGALNIMVAASSLLRPNGLLRMELLIQREEPTEVLEQILHGDLDTVSAILGLALLEHGTNASAATSTDVLQLHAKQAIKSPQEHKQPIQSFTWKAVPSVMLEGKELGDILYVMYRSMFQSESISKRLSSMMAAATKGLQFPYFNRRSFALLLRATQPSSDNWRLTVARLLQLIESDSDIMMTGHYIQELYMQLHLLKLHTTEVLENHSFIRHEFPSVQQMWSHYPPTIWITIKIPESKIKLFKVPVYESPYGSLPVHGIVEHRSHRRQNFFSVLQMGFGSVQTAGSGESLVVRINEDSRGWKGKSALIVSFRVPSWILMAEGKKTGIGFGLQSTISTTATMVSKLGLEMKIFETTLDNTAHVFISKDPPNMTVDEDGKSHTYVARGGRTVRGVVVDRKLKKMVARISVLGGAKEGDLPADGKVITHRTNPWEYELELAGNKHKVVFPAPTSVASDKTHIARKPGYLELTAHVANIRDRAETSPFPLRITNHGCALINVPRVSLDGLPTLNLEYKPEWLSEHLATSFSTVAKDLRMSGLVSASDSRNELKESIHSMYMLASGVYEHGGNPQMLSLYNDKSGGIAVIILVDKLRLDLSNQTVLLDAAILPILRYASSTVLSLLLSWSNHGLGMIKVNDRTLELWKQILPAFIERCRTWSHTEDCEVKKAGRVPLSYAPKEAFFCTCGNGKFPNGYLRNLDGWSDMTPYCVRAAFSPCFAIPYVKDLIDVEGIKKANPGCCHCKKETGAVRDPLKECGRCHVVKYCSQECQKKDWSKHKQVCKMLAEEATKAKAKEDDKQL